MRSRRKLFQQAVGVALPAGLAIFGVAEGVKWVRRKPAVSGVAPIPPGESRATIELQRTAPPARPRVWSGASAAAELRAGDRVAFWTRVEPMTPDRLAEVSAVTLAVRLRSAAGASSNAACSMHSSGAAWTELCGNAVCLRTAPACVLVAPSSGGYTIEANVEWLDGREPTAAAVEAFVQRAK